VKGLDLIWHANFWDRFNFTPESVGQEGQRRLRTTTSLNDIIDIEKRDRIEEEIAGGVQGVLRNNSININHSAITTMVCELVDNFSRHSEQTLGAFMMQYYPNAEQLILAVADCGIGIRASLSTNPKYAYLSSRPHHEALAKAFEPLVTRFEEGGMGLKDVRDEIQQLDGTFILSTGDAYVKFTNQREEIGSMAYELPGVQIELTIPVEV